MDIESTYQDLLDSPVDTATVNEANQRDTVPTGSYRLDVTKKELREASEKSPWPGRLMVALQADPSGIQDGARGPKLFVDISPVVNRTNSNRLDGPSSLWGQVVKTLGLDTGTVRQVFDAVDMYPYKAYIEEAFQVDAAHDPTQKGGGWRTPKSPEARKTWIEKGFTRRNFVRNVTRLA